VVFDEHEDGDYKIYAGALEAPQGQGYIAALVVVNRACGPARAPREAFRDDSLACGHRWPTPREALAYALQKARVLIHREQHRLAC